MDETCSIRRGIWKIMSPVLPFCLMLPLICEWGVWGSSEEHERVRERYTNEFNRIVVGQSTCTYLQGEL